MYPAHKKMLNQFLFLFFQRYHFGHFQGKYFSFLFDGLENERYQRDLKISERPVAVNPTKCLSKIFSKPQYLQVICTTEF